ncbi:unnamed protein product, partial [Cyprideis torosa]
MDSVVVHNEFTFKNDSNELLDSVLTSADVTSCALSCLDAPELSVVGQTIDYGSRGVLENDDYELDRVEQKKGKLETCVESVITKHAVAGQKPTHSSDSNRGPVFHCQTCSKSFSRLSNLKAHELIHKGVKSFKCNICPKAFSRNSTLQTHLLSHSGEKPFSCMYCEKSYIQKSDLNTHEQIHTGEKRFNCSICPKAYMRKRDLHAHEQTHDTTKKCFPCSICSVPFSEMGYLIRHTKTHDTQYPKGS